VCPRSFGQRLKYAFGPPLVDTASPSFDARLMIRCAAREEALELVDEKVRAKLITFPRRPKVDCKRGIASISWRGTSLDPAVLDAACELIAALCRSRDANSRDRKLISV
jgi:hypothetical protein